MRVNHKPTGTASSMTGGLAQGVFAAMSLTLVLAGVLAVLIGREVVCQENMGYGVMGILFSSAAVGSTVAYTRIKHRRAMVFLLSALAFLVSLTALTALFFGGQFEGIFPTAMLIIGGSGVAFFLSVRRDSTLKSRKIRKQFR